MSLTRACKNEKEKEKEKKLASKKLPTSLLQPAYSLYNYKNKIYTCSMCRLGFSNNSYLWFCPLIGFCAHTRTHTMCRYGTTTTISGIRHETAKFVMTKIIISGPDIV